MTPFRLANLFRVRQIQEDRAAAELAVAAGERARMENLTERARKRLEETCLPESAEALRWQAAVATRSAASSMVLEADAARIAAISQEDAAQQMWNAARARTTMIEKLAVKHQQEQRMEDVKKEQNVLDEIASQRSTDKDAQ
mgnify:CR=1 FL=1